jgi:hypothetical protein
MVGIELGDARELARRELRGPTSCTHLSSTLRTLADCAAFVDTLA